jgi:hypothetical protein
MLNCGVFVWTPLRKMAYRKYKYDQAIIRRMFMKQAIKE